MGNHFAIYPNHIRDHYYNHNDRKPGSKTNVSNESKPKKEITVIQEEQVQEQVQEPVQEQVQEPVQEQVQEPVQEQV